jgi:Fe(3+) dicitrate transport protein
MKPTTRLDLAATAVLLAVTCVARAQDAAQEVESLGAMTVVGSAEAVWTLAGAAAYVDAEEFRERGYTNLGQVLAKVPGVYVREEDGFSNFPNISLRGADGTRSEKVTVMEDGILTAPSPYSAPAAYYSPKPARMSGIEVLKGSSQVKYGPQTTGGVINFLSTEIPADSQFYSRTTYGSWNTFFNHTWYGDTVETEAGRFGYLLELHSQSSDGYRDTDFGGDSGFDVIEPMLKMFWEPNTALKQRIEIKAGYTDFDADETYTGLSEFDVRATPDRRYAATKFDEFTSEQWRSYLKWIIEPSDALRFETALYYNEFNRNWDKLDQVNGTSLHQALLNPALVNVLNGSAAGTIRTTANLRDHQAYGWQNQANIRFDTGSLAHDLAIGARFHYDRVDAQQQRTTYTGMGNGGFTLNPGQPGPITNNGINDTFATALYVEDEIKAGKLTLRPGVRYEFLELDFTNAAGRQFAGNENLFAGGMGANYELDDCNSLFGGIYRGVASPSPQAYLTAGTENEESIGYELGYRHRQDAFNAELVGFYTDFDQLISTDAGFGFTNPSQNAGEADVFGIESLIQYDAGEAQGWGVGLPVYLSATWTSAEFKNTSASVAGGGDAVYAGGRDGNEIPYVPEWKLAAGIGVTGEKWGVNLDMTYTGTSWGTGWNGTPRVNIPSTPANEGIPTIRDGKIDALLLFDLSGHYQLTENVKLLAGVQNLFDQQGIVSRIPEGPRANAPRMLFGGAEITF